MATMRIASGLLAAASVAAGSWIPEIITRDVAIIGGGASGSYAAIRLKEDFNQSIVVIEKADRMVCNHHLKACCCTEADNIQGGHVATYDDPKTAESFNYAVQTFNDYGPARSFFERMGVPVGPMARNALVSQYADFTTGLAVNFTPPANADRTDALRRLLNITAPYEDLFLPGYWNFPSPDKIPADLLLPFGEFVSKYDLHAAVNQVFQVTGMGVGDMANALTLYVLGAFGQPMIRGFLGQADSFVPTSRRNIDLYEAVQARLGDDVLLNSVVTQSLRTSIGHTLWVKDSLNKKYMLVVARKLLIAIEPTEQNMAPFGLDIIEQGVFSKFRHTRVHAGIVSHPSLPKGGSVINEPAAAAPNNYLELPELNFNVRFDHMGADSDLWRVMLVGKPEFDADKAQALVREGLGKLIEKGTLPETEVVEKLEVRAWADHGAMHMNVEAEELRKGFIQKLYALQGKRGTWWTGAAFAVQFQSILWAFDDVLIPKMLA